MARGKGKTGKSSKKKRGKGFSTEEFLGHVETHAGGGGGLFLNLKKAGKAIGFIHPVVGIRARTIRGAMIPSRIEKDGDVEVKGRRFNQADPSDADVITSLIDFAQQKIEDGVDEGILVLNGGKKGKWTLGDLAQQNTEDNWRTSLKLKTEYVIAFVQRTEDRPADNPVQFLMAPTSLGKAIKRVIEQEIEDRGSKKGDPMETPYGFRLTFDKDADPADMYDAARVDDQICPMDEETERILNADEDDFEGIDMDAHVRPGHVGDMKHAVESTWDCKEIHFAEFNEFMGACTEDGGGEKEAEPEGSGGDDKDEPADDDKPSCWGEFEDDDKDCADCDLHDACEKKTKGGKKSPKRGKSSGKSSGDKMKCPCCKKSVTPNSKDKCPNCMEKLKDDSDIPF